MAEQVWRPGSVRGEASEAVGGGEPAFEADGGGFESGQADARGRHQAIKKLVTPAAKRRAAGRLLKTYRVSQRRVCRLLKLHRSVARYRSVDTKNDEALKARLKELADQFPRYGYLLLHQLLKNEGLVVNRKRTYRLYVELGLQVRIQRRKKLSRPRVPMPVPSRPNERCSVDFMSDQLANGRRLRILNLVDYFFNQRPSDRWDADQVPSICTTGRN